MFTQSLDDLVIYCMLEDKRAFVGHFDSQWKGLRLGWTKFAAGMVLFASAPIRSSAQSFNIDLDESIGGPETGAGAPSAAFGAAAGQAGYWNKVPASSGIARALIGLDGVATSRQIDPSGGGGSGGFNNPNLSGDFRALMADGRDVGTPVYYHFKGFQPGHYQLITFGAPASGTVVPLFVSVPNSSTSTQNITGPMPANLFVYGIDYCVHELDMPGDSFEIDISANGPPNSQVHGFQIVYTPVPESATCFVCILGVIGLLVRRTSKMQTKTVN